MKIRNGFVSNSSSSSFILLMNPEVKDWKEIFKSPEMIDSKKLCEINDNEKLEDKIKVLADILNSTEPMELEGERLTPLSFSEVPNYRELLVDESSFLFNELWQQTYSLILSKLDKTNYKGNLGYDLNHSFRDLLYGKDSELHDLALRITKEFIDNFLKATEDEEENIRFVYFTIDDELTTSENNWDICFLRSNWKRLIATNVEVLEYINL